MSLVSVLTALVLAYLHSDVCIRHHSLPACEILCLNGEFLWFHPCTTSLRKRSGLGYSGIEELSPLASLPFLLQVSPKSVVTEGS